MPSPPHCYRKAASSGLQTNPPLFHETFHFTFSAEARMVAQLLCTT